MEINKKVYENLVLVLGNEKQALTIKKHNGFFSFLLFFALPFPYAKRCEFKMSSQNDNDCYVTFTLIQGKKTLMYVLI